MSDNTLSEQDAKAYAQWVTMEITNYGSVPIKIKGMYLSWGKLYINDNKDQEVGISQYEGKVIQSGENVKISSCGRSDASSGTEGGFTLVDPSKNDAQIRWFYWDCPWGSKTNTWTVGGTNDGWVVESKGANLYGGGLGNITVDVLNKPF